MQQFGIGLVVTVLGSLIVGAFRRRQLYVVVPRLFSDSPLTSSGKLVELRVFNRGRRTEENVRVALDPSIRYEVVASSDNSPSLIESAICIPRIPPGDDSSVLLLVEGGDFSNERISKISSASSKGRLIQKMDQVPHNLGNSILLVTALLALFALPIVGIEYYSNWKSTARLERLSDLAENGWTDLGRYSDSRFRDNYSDGEFPIHLLETTRDGNVIAVKFRIVNKASAPLRLRLFVRQPYIDQDPEPWKLTTLEYQTIEPKGVEDLAVRIYWPVGSTGNVKVDFSMSAGNEDHLKAIRLVDIDI